MNTVDVVVDGIHPVARGLQSLVEKWLGADCPLYLRIRECGGTARHPKRYVRVEVPRRKDGTAMYFFFDDDGSWSALPQEEQGLAMSPHLFAA